MSDLETELRAMRQRRAGDITTLPENLVPAVDDEVLDTRRSSGRLPGPWSPVTRPISGR